MPTTSPDSHGPGISVVVHARRALFLETLTKAFVDQGDRILASGRDPLEVADLVCLHEPDAFVLDATEDSAWLAAAHTVRRRAPGVKLLVLCAASPEPVRSAYADEVVDAAVECGCTFGQLDAALVRTVLGLRCPPNAVGSPAPDTGPTVLTVRERQVLERLAGGATTSAIAEALDISPHTVRSHVQSVMRKLDVHGRGRAVSVALATNLVEARVG